MSDKAIELEVVPTTATEAIERAQIDVQIATAHKFPRSLDVFYKTAIDMVSQDIETAESCIYKRPVGKDENGKQKIIEGESVRSAEIVAASYGNVRIGSIITEQTPRYVKARGFAHDLQTNNAQYCEIVEPTVDRNGNPYSERQRAIVAAAALSKARRNATFLIIPRALCKKIINEAKRIAIGDISTLDSRRASAMKWIDALKIDKKRVFDVLEIKGEADIGLEQLETLTGLRTAIKDGDVAVDEAFPTATKKEVISGIKFGDSKKETPKKAVEPQTKEPKELIFIRIEEFEVSRLAFENQLKKLNVLSTAETLDSISNEKAQAILDKIAEYIQGMKK